MSTNFILRSGKYVGKTMEWVENHDPSYLVWVEENRPQMLKEPKKVEIKNFTIEAKSTAIQPNLDFWKDPNPHRFEYMAKNIIKKEEPQKPEEIDEWGF